jgi:FKBP-type peptidyl-prolyl cis-trans isomerase
MTQTGTGLHYMVYSKSESQDTAKVGDVVTVDFEISLLNGQICYTSEIKGPESFMVEKSDIESGLHEGIQYMCPGDRAKFIIPSLAAHGLVGDTDKIPPLTTVIYDIELIRIEQ